MKEKYDVFISYRRKWGALYSRILQLKLQGKGYKVFLDYDELKDGHFDEKIRDAIKHSSLFVFMFSKDALDRCNDKEDWVRQEICYAIEQKKHIIPVVPDREESVIPKDIPSEIIDAISRNQHSNIDYGEALDSSVDSLVSDRLVPHIGKRNPVEKRIIKWVFLAAVSACIVTLSYRFVSDSMEYNSCRTLREYYAYQAEHQGLFHFYKDDAARKLQDFKNAMPPEDTLDLTIHIDEGITLEQLTTCRAIVNKMIEVEGGTYMMGASDSDSDADEVMEKPQLETTVGAFLIGKYEVSVREWNSILGRAYDEEDADYPMTDITWYECQAFVDSLYSLTGLNFSLPTEAEWEWAARGGCKSNGTFYSGSSDVNEVAVYAKNSKGRPHKRAYGNADRLGLEPNELDIYDMSGSVEEWCSDDFREYQDLKTHTLNPKVHDGESKVIRGGSYESSASEVRITSRGPKATRCFDGHRSASPTVGLRLIIRK